MSLRVTFCLPGSCAGGAGGAQAQRGSAEVSTGGWLTENGEHVRVHLPLHVPSNGNVPVTPECDGTLGTERRCMLSLLQHAALTYTRNEAAACAACRSMSTRTARSSGGRLPTKHPSGRGALAGARSARRPDPRAASERLAAAAKGASNVQPFQGRCIRLHGVRLGQGAPAACQRMLWCILEGTLGDTLPGYIQHC